MESELYRAFRAGWLIKVFGFILIIGGAFLLYWNEGQSVNFIVSLDEALNHAHTIDASQEAANSFNGHLVHISGPLVVGEPLTEPDYNIDVMAVKLKRRVQMYQHVEESTDTNVAVDGITETRSYYYRKEWRDDLIDSRSFQVRAGHQNPTSFPLESSVQLADAVYIGNFELSKEVKERFTNFIEVTSDTRPDDPQIKLHAGFYYHTVDVFNPEVGDIRILFSFAGMEGDIYTIVGVLENNKIVPYQSTRDLQMILLHPGERKIDEIFRSEYANQRLTAWRFRFMGWVLVFFGITCISNLVHIALRDVPIVKNMVPDPNAPICANLVFATSLFLTIASVVWLIHRPMLACGLLVAAMSPFLWFARGIDYIQ